MNNNPVVPPEVLTKFPETSAQGLDLRNWVERFWSIYGKHGLDTTSTSHLAATPTKVALGAGPDWASDGTNSLMPDVPLDVIMSVSEAESRTDGYWLSRSSMARGHRVWISNDNKVGLQFVGSNSAQGIPPKELFGFNTGSFAKVDATKVSVNELPFSLTSDEENAQECIKNYHFEFHPFKFHSSDLSLFLFFSSSFIPHI